MEKNRFLNLPIFCFCDKPKPKSKGGSSTDRHQGNPPFLQRSTSLSTLPGSQSHNQQQKPDLACSPPHLLLFLLVLGSSMNLDMPVIQYVATVNIHCNITVEELSFWTEGSRLQTQKLFWFSVFHRTKWSCNTVVFPPFLCVSEAGLLTGGWSQIRPTKCNNIAQYWCAQNILLNLGYIPFE